MKMIHQVERIAWVVCMSLCARLHQAYTYHIYSNKRRGAYQIFRASNAVLIRGRLLFEGRAYSKIGRSKEKNAENRLLALTNFFVANAALSSRAALVRGPRLFE